jgi:L-methionine (R)-S-oxide reductase
MTPLPFDADIDARRAHYAECANRIQGLIDGEDDWIAILATVACELHHGFEAFHWTGFYRVTEPRLLVIGPYQGGHGCIRIPFDRGVCGAAARNRQTQLVPDVHEFPGHIACSSTTRSEIVVPVFDRKGRVVAVLDVDSDHVDAFDALDQKALEAICGAIGKLHR